MTFKDSERPSGSSDKDEYIDGMHADNVVDIAVARMKSGAVVKESRTARLKWVFWVAGCFGFLVWFSQLDFVHQTPESSVTNSGIASVRLKQNPQGHYLTKGEINGHPVKFLVDTGATSVAIPTHVAERIGLKKGQQRRAMTAGGITVVHATRLDSVSLGDITLSRVEGSITSDMPGDQILLGMTFLKKLNINQNDGVLTISTE